MPASFLGRASRSGTPGTTLSRVTAALAALLIAGCGGGGDGAAPTTSTGGASGGTTQSSGGTGATGSTGGGTSGGVGSGGTGGGVSTPTASGAATTATRQEAWRLLTQATFGPTDTAIAQVMATGVTPWVDAQLAKPVSAAYLARWDADDRRIAAATPGATANATSVISQFYAHALNSDDQLRHRVAFALSEIFVVSTVDLKGFHARSGAAFMDMLNRDAFGNYRTLLQHVTLSPAMGQYLNMLHNGKESLKTGQVPDQNYAREVMQLFSIGLVQLNADGTTKTDASGRPLDSYTQADVEGLSKALTGWSWGGPDTTSARFNGNVTAQDPNRMAMPMQAYPQFHSLSEKRFLGAVVPAQTVASPATSLKVALDTIFNHPNVGPFIGRQLIQRLVTSHPSPAYVGRVAAVFNDNGSGVRGDLKAVVRALLLDPEARSGSLATSSDSYGKVREPVLRLTAWMRAFNAKSDSGQALVTGTDDPGLELGQSPLRASSVFNFFRPGYVAAGAVTGARDLTMPELQITSETSVAGYVNFMSAAVQRGVGLRGFDGTASRPDVHADMTAELSVADQSATLVDRVTAKLLGDTASAALKTELRAAVDSIVVPALRAGGTNQKQVDAARQNRVNAAVLLTLASPEFIVQK